MPYRLKNSPLPLCCFTIKLEKMRHFVTILVVCFGWQIDAQITVTNLTFPSIGDSLRYQTDANPTNLMLGTVSGGNQLWDFSALQGGPIQTTVYQEATTGAGFPNFQNANLRTGNQLQETYLKKTATALESLGTSGADQLNLVQNTAVRYQPPLPLRRAPMNFFDIHNFDSDLTYSLPTGDLADTLLGNLGGLFDSIRIRIHTSRLDVVDGWGVCKIPGGQFEVLREKRTEISETSIDIHSFLGWTDLTALLGGGGGLLEAIGQDTTVSLHFFSHLEKEEIAVLTLNNAGDAVRSARFKYIPSTSATTFKLENKIVTCAPNPTTGLTELKWTDLESGVYRLVVNDFSGKMIVEKEVTMDQAGNMTLDFSHATAGILTLQIIDQNNQTLAVSKLLKL
jgi:hypothetical protein